MDDFATRLKRFMFLKGVRQVDIAERTGINKGNISRWMRGENVPYGENLYKLAKALGVTVDELLGREEPPISKLTIPSAQKVDVLGSVSAGIPIELQEDIIGTIYTNSDKKGLFAVKVKGDSMSPRIMDGDTLLVRSQDTAEDGDLVIARIDNEVTCKVFKRSHNTVTLVPFNATYAPLVYSGQDIEDLHILGKVVESRHEW
jgi:SOS-response transcriptional repressors (RecA-mediated autopeptidases)